MNQSEADFQWNGMSLPPNPYFVDDAVVIYHGNCMELLPLMPKVDLVLTDPPYGINHKSHGQIFVHAEQIVNDDGSYCMDYLLDYIKEAQLPAGVFYSPYKPTDGWRSILVWDKGSHLGIGGDRETCWKRDFELIGIANNKPLNGQRDSAILDFSGIKIPESGHVAEKPIALMAYLVSKLSNQSDTVLDPFMGSGTTLRAAKNLGRKAIGIEIEERYCEIAAKRMSQGVLL